MSAVPQPRADRSPGWALARTGDADQVLAVSGHLDVQAAADLRLALGQALQAGTGDLVVDLSAVRAMDATGLGVLVGAHRQAGRLGRTLVLRDVAEPVARLLLLTRLERVLTLRRTTRP